MYVKPDLDTTLANLRTNTEAWKTSLARHSSDERRGKGLAWDVELMEERDDISAKIVEDFATIDAELSKRRVIDSVTPSEWTIDRLTDEQIAACKADWPELGMFDDTTIRQVADVLGIRMVRELARQAVRRSPDVLSLIEARASK
ncbi:hypothetical protein ACWCY6_17905 [Streptomyces sp. 900105755]